MEILILMLVALTTLGVALLVFGYLQNNIDTKLTGFSILMLTVIFGWGIAGHTIVMKTVAYKEYIMLVTPSNSSTLAINSTGDIVWKNTESSNFYLKDKKWGEFMIEKRYNLYGNLITNSSTYFLLEAY